MCIKHTGTPVSLAALNAPGSCNARTSLMSPAPAFTASRITSALLVSIEITHCAFFATASITGMVLSSSSCSETSGAPGRVDSPPMSINLAPSSIMRSAWSKACFTSACLPPSEKESGVTFKIPITCGCDKPIKWFPNCMIYLRYRFYEIKLKSELILSGTPQNWYLRIIIRECEICGRWKSVRSNKKRQ